MFSRSAHLRMEGSIWRTKGIRSGRRNFTGCNRQAPRYFRFLGRVEQGRGTDFLQGCPASWMWRHLRSDRISTTLAGSGSRATATTSNICIRGNRQVQDWTKPTTLIIVGAGNLGQALFNYMNLNGAALFSPGSLIIIRRCTGVNPRHRVRPMEEVADLLSRTM